jgi:hypothetical protein
VLPSLEFLFRMQLTQSWQMLLNSVRRMLRLRVPKDKLSHDDDLNKWKFQ